MDAAEILDRGADNIDRWGWWNGKDDANRGGKACAIIGMALVTAFCDDAIDELSKAVGFITKWNDASDAETVTSTMRAVAATLRAQANTEPYARNDKTAEQAEICG